MKRLTILVTLIICLSMLTSCSSKKIADAEIAFSEADYESVITLLSDLNIEDPNVNRMLVIAKAYVAYAKGEYQLVIDLLSGVDGLDDPHHEILVLSEAYIAYGNEDYQKVVDLLTNVKQLDDASNEILKASTAYVYFADEQYLAAVKSLAYLDNRKNFDVYNDSVDVLIETSLQTLDAKTITELYKLENSVENIIFNRITEKCNSYDYNYFLLLDSVILELPDSDFKSKLETFDTNNGKMRAKAFMQGEWQMVYDDGDTAIVKVHVNDDDAKCIGILTQVSDFMKTYFYEENDLYWSDFIFDGDVPISVSHLVRYTNGDSYTKLCSFEIDYENNRILIHVTGVTKSDRIWERMS